MQVERPRKYRNTSLLITLSLLAAWFIISLGCGVIFRKWLDEHLPNIGNAPFGFWMAQQGSIIGFVLILIIYATMMNNLDRKYGYSEE
ncbi:hypothetical protein Rhal01_02285 [Rubritalea halochordaticola]|uniref:Sodium symporter small subunit domain-containing protein n=1 Tax=Rubritalea halochordaticola TaxID=714537 RepID=A0ABP9V2F9_9BACT